MEVIQKLSGKSYGGVLCHKFSIVEAAGIDVMDDAANNYVQSVTLLAGYNWVERNCRMNTLDFTESEVVKNGSKVYVSTMPGAIARDHQETINKMTRDGRIGVVIRWTDRNNNTKMMGSKESPARLNWGRANKTEMGNANEITFTITCTNRMPVVATQP